jgi:uncharacterized protein YycO
MLYIGAFKGKGFISKLIKWRTGGEYSHIGVFLDNKYWIDAYFTRGVKKLIYKPDQNGIEVDIYKVELKTENEVRKFLSKQIGKNYDLRAVLNIGVCHKENRKLSNKWMCSELVYAALLKDGINIFNDTAAWEVDPNMLMRSTVFRYLETIKVIQKPFIF